MSQHKAHELRSQDFDDGIILKQVDVSVVAEIVIKFYPFIGSEILIWHISLLEVVCDHFINYALGPLFIYRLAKVKSFLNPLLNVLLVSSHCLIDKRVMFS